MTVCTVCKKDSDRTYWSRLFPDDILCYDCFSNPNDSSLIRRGLAKIIWELRKQDRKAAYKAWVSLRGKGVPLNLRIPKK